MNLSEYQTYENRTKAAKKLMKYLENSRDSEGVNAIITLCDETGNELTDYGVPRLTKYFDISDYLFYALGIQKEIWSAHQYYLINTNDLIQVAKSVLTVTEEIGRGKFWMWDNCGNICAGNSMAEILRNTENGIFEVCEEISKIIYEDCEYAETVLQSFPHFLAACKPIFDAVRDEEK